MKKQKLQKNAKKYELWIVNYELITTFAAAITR